jgi:hypothetical protein
LAQATLTGLYEKQKPKQLARENQANARASRPK